MTQQMRDLQLAQARKPPGPSSPNAAKRLYRNLSGKFRVNYTSFDEGSLVGRGEKEKLRKSYLVSACWLHPGGDRGSVGAESVQVGTEGSLCGRCWNLGGSTRLC